MGTCTPQIEELKKRFQEYGITIKGRTGHCNDRTKEIKEYIIKYEIKQYLILDDDKSEFVSGLLPNTYIVNSRIGLTKQDVNKIIKQYK